MRGEIIGTFSITARDPETGQLGIAVQSKFLAVGAVVPWAKATAGAVAIQAWANPRQGARALVLLEAGRHPTDVLSMLLVDDDERNIRQIGIVDTRGRVAAHTGKHCIPWAGHVVGDDFVCAGNILASERVVAAMADGFRASNGPFAARLVDALAGGQGAGGDARGRESAALLVVRENGDYKGLGDKHIDLRIDHHPEPIQELRRLLTLHEARFQWTDNEIVAITEEFALKIQMALRVLGYYEGPLNRTVDQPTEAALRRYYAAAGVDEGALLAQGRMRVATYERLRRGYATM